jgi:hypothetical protein
VTGIEHRQRAGRRDCRIGPWLSGKWYNRLKREYRRDRADGRPFANRSTRAFSNGAADQGGAAKTTPVPEMRTAPEGAARSD